jgi:hypothetical protein
MRHPVYDHDRMTAVVGRRFLRLVAAIGDNPDALRAVDRLTRAVFLLGCSTGHASADAVPPVPRPLSRGHGTRSLR